jgi:RHS repeat-associated protein
VSENPYLYGGGLQDRATGHLEYGARWYDPVTGSWTQQDTRNTPLDPANANRYQYAAGDPINNADPTGAFSWGTFTSTVSSFAGTFAVAGRAIVGGTLGLLGAPSRRSPSLPEPRPVRSSGAPQRE